MLNEPHSFQYNDTTEIDEHDEPTEPMRRADVAAFVPTIPDTPLPSDVPSPKSATQPFPQQYVQPVSSLQGGLQHIPPLSPAYPAMPIVPSSSPENVPVLPVSPVAANNPSRQKRVRGKVIPIAVGMCFVALQTLLLFRFLLKVLNVSSDNALVGMIYAVSNVFVLPFRILFLQLAISQVFTVELYTLLAILVYGIISRILVHILKALFKTR
jgi:hypothetical protein